MKNRQRYPATLAKVISGSLIACTINGGHAAEPAEQLAPITVQAGSENLLDVFILDDQTSTTSADTSELLKSVPGANTNRNGPLTGQAQYRGMFADRINVLVDDVHINSGGPNGMDPALSYITPGEIERLEVIRGIAPVSSPGESIGGSISAEPHMIDFNDQDGIARELRLTTGGSTAEHALFVGGSAGFANDRHRLQLMGNYQIGDDTEFPNGTILPTEYQRGSGSIRYGLMQDGHTLDLGYRRNETGHTGTPSLPMDIRYIDANVLNAKYRGGIAGHDVQLDLYASDVDHKMDNFTLREPPNPTQTRLNHTTSDGMGFSLMVSRMFADGELRLGVDGNFDEHDALITDPINNPNLRVTGFNDITRDLLGAFAEWEGSLDGDWSLRLGGRYNRVNSDSGKVSHFMAAVNPGIATIQDRFNQADRNQSENNIDIVAKLTRQVSVNDSVIVEAGRKTRAPSYQEMYLWIPMQATNGLADGHNYMGDIELDSEVSYEIGLGYSHRTKSAYFEPRIFYRYVDDYIQGIPSTDPLVIKISTANGDANPLQWSNVDASFYGLDATFGTEINDSWKIDGILSYVRGKREDIDDDLYRIAPPNARISLTYSRDDWWTALESELYARQDNVAESNNEQESDSYALVNLHSGFMLRQLEINTGIDNLLDKHYIDHLTGINRVGSSDVPVGEKIPGSGRSFYLNVTYVYD